MRSILLALTLMLAASAARADCVVLLHGLSRTENSMRVLQEVLEFHGYTVVNRSYPSESAPIGDLVRHVETSAAECGAQRMHLVTHSLGGILVRAWLAQGHPPNLGRVVMLAPPNHGSEIVDTLGEMQFLRDAAEWLNGPATNQLGTDPASVPNLLPPVDFDLGVIAGDIVLNPVGAVVIGGPSDGTVSVQSTRVAGMRDHIVVSTSHSLIMMNPIVMAEVLEYLRNGVFDHGITFGAALRKLSRPWH